MRKVAKLLTDYVIKKSMVDEADREVYEYGFVITLEVGLFLVAMLVHRTETRYGLRRDIFL